MLDQRLIGKFPTAMLALALLLLASPAAAREGGTVRGSATVRDADTVVVGGTTVVRLRGVDAEELRTPRGWQAKQAMRAIVGDGDLVCRLTVSALGAARWGSVSNLMARTLARRSSPGAGAVLSAIRHAISEVRNRGRAGCATAFELLHTAHAITGAIAITDIVRVITDIKK
jgi:hypothetical protein